MAGINGPEIKISVRCPDQARRAEHFGPMEGAGMAVLKFERGEMQLALFRRRDGFIWFHGRKQFSRPLSTTAAAVQFLGDLCAIYNYTLDLALPPPDGEQA